MNTPIEQEFDFSETFFTETLNKWLHAVAKIPFLDKGNHSFCVFGNTLKNLASMNNTEISTVSNNSADLNKLAFLTTRISGMRVETGFLEDQDCDPSEYCFYVQLYPYCAEYELLVIFYHNNIAVFEQGFGDYSKLLEKIDGKINKKITWQEAYNLMCEISRIEQVIPKIQE